MESAHTATLAASMNDIASGPGETVLLAQVLEQRRMIARMVEAMQGDVSLQQILDRATETAARGCGAPMAKVLEMEAPDHALIIKSQYGMAPSDVGRTAGTAAPGNPPGEALTRAAPVVDPDVRRRPPSVLPAIFSEKSVVTSVNLPLINYDGAYGVLEVDFREQVEVNALHMSFLAAVAGILAESIEKHRARAALSRERDAKAVLLKEQQHRIRNNFQTIVAMVQRSTLKADGDSNKTLREIERRIFAMASLYDHLLGLSEQAEHADLGRYLGALATNFNDFYDLKGSGIAFRIEFEFGIVVGLDTCTTIGTIVNELVANSIEHAFAGGSGEITVSLGRVGQQGCVVTVADNGKGLSTPALEESIGLRTVRHMLDGIGGRLDMETAPERGVRWTITIDGSRQRRRHAE